MEGRYFGVSEYFKKTYGEKWIKLSIDGGFTCPNRDGTLATAGCAFCSESGSGEFSGVIRDGKRVEDPRSGVARIDISNQVESQMALLHKKWGNRPAIAYFQSFTNTYKPLDALRILYNEALACEGVEGLVIATRPDCISEAHCELFSKSKVMWVELGLQTIHDEKAAWMNRHYTYQNFIDAYQLLSSHGIKCVVHLIAGLPGESRHDFLESVRAVNALKPFGVKLHMLNILEGTTLGEYFKAAPFDVLEQTEYIEWICDALERLSPEIVIHRLTGDGEKHRVIAPKWVFDKRSVLNGINKCLAARGTQQGTKITESY
ncbi:MAG: TIGR01212 family radical SAM protein [Firmicutes bacterium]|nr:TIGR01212 family radical SAM protein [Bacillota bacterium]